MSSPKCAPALPHELPTNDESLERRRHPRYKCNIHVVCKTFEGSRIGQSWPGSVLDLSTGGMRIEIARRFEVGTLLFVEVSDSSMPQRIARIRRVVRKPGERFSLGCVLEKSLDPHDLQEMLSA